MNSFQNLHSLIYFEYMNTLTNKQWAVLQPLLPKQNQSKGGRTRADDRKVTNGILWVLRTGAQWYEMPRRFGSYTTVWRRHKQWEQDGTWKKIWDKLLARLAKEKKIDWSYAMLDGSFASAKKGGVRLDKQKKARGQRSCFQQTEKEYRSQQFLPQLQYQSSNLPFLPLLVSLLNKDPSILENTLKELSQIEAMMQDGLEKQSGNKV